jgi:hypothetical protein
MKSLQDLMKDYFSDGADGHVCSLAPVPKYFFYGGKEYTLDFSALDSVHTELMAHRSDEGLLGELSEQEALELFKGMVLP